MPFPVSIFGALLGVLAIFSVTPVLSGAEEEDTPLAKEMSVMNKSYRALKKQIGDVTKKDSSIELVQAMKKSAVAGKDYSPAKAKEVPENDKAKFAEGYKASVDGLIAHFDKIEKALVAGNNEEAKTLFNEINAMKRKGHEEFQADADSEEGDKG